IRLEEVRTRVAEAEELMGTGRTDEAIARLTELVEHPRFEIFAETTEGRAAVFRLGDALGAAGVYEPARAYLRRVVKSKGAWTDNNGAYARRAVRRLVEIALESQNFDGGQSDVKDVPPDAPQEIQGDIHYMLGRAREAAGDREGALVEYSKVPQRSRYWAQ